MGERMRAAAKPHHLIELALPRQPITRAMSAESAMTGNTTAFAMCPEAETPRAGPLTALHHAAGGAGRGGGARDELGHLVLLEGGVGNVRQLE